MKKIIVPIDFSDHSEYALKVAVKLAKKNNAEIFVLHMLELHEGTISESETFHQEQAILFLKLAEKKFSQFLNKNYLKGIKITPIIKHYKVFSEINEIAKEQQVDLVIMGSHGVGGVKEYFIGSNTEKVIRHSNIPVLVIKNELKDINFDEVVFACDFSDESIDSYKKAIEILKLLSVKINLLYVNLPTEKFISTREMENKAAIFIKKTNGSLEEINKVNYVCDYSIEKGVLNFSNAIGADLIAIITYGRRGLSHFFKGSVSEDIANHSTLPVITFKV